MTMTEKALRSRSANFMKEPSASRPTSRVAASGETVFRAGDHVIHPAFGAGIVVSSAVRPDDEEVTVAFAGKGVKKLMASFAGLTKG